MTTEGTPDGADEVAEAELEAELMEPETEADTLAEAEETGADDEAGMVKLHWNGSLGFRGSTVGPLFCATQLYYQS